MFSKIINDKEASLQQLSTNLKLLMKSKNLSPSQLSQALEIPQQTIRRLMSGETADPRISTLKQIADYFEKSVDMLIGNNSQALIQPLKNGQPRLVPLLDWKMLEMISDIRALDVNLLKNWQSIPSDIHEPMSQFAFALESRPSMCPRFPEGTIFIIDPELAFMDGDLVLVKLRKNNELTLRGLIVDPPEWRLQSTINELNTLVYVQEEHELIGVNLLTMLYNRKL